MQFEETKFGRCSFSRYGVVCLERCSYGGTICYPPENAEIGERGTFEGYDGDPEAENKFAKKKMMDTLGPDLKTDENGVVVWKGAKSVTSAGPCVASEGMKDAHVR